MDQKDEVGDRLRSVIQRAVLALMRDDVVEAWQILDGLDAARACIEWDRLRGREVPSAGQLEHARLSIILALGGKLK